MNTRACRKNSGPCRKHARIKEYSIDLVETTSLQNPHTLTHVSPSCDFTCDWSKLNPWPTPWEHGFSTMWVARTHAIGIGLTDSLRHHGSLIDEQLHIDKLFSVLVSTFVCAVDTKSERCSSEKYCLTLIPDKLEVRVDHVYLRLVFTSDGVVIRSVERYDLVKPTKSEAEQWFRLWLRRFRASENCSVGVASRSGRIKQSQCSILGLVIGLFFRFRLRQPSFHWVISDGVVNGIGRNGNVLILPTPIPSSL